MKSLLLLAATVLMTGLLTGCSGEQTKTEKTKEPTVLKIGVDPTFPPFESIDSASGEMVGYDIDLIQKICEINSWQYELVAIPFEQILSDLTKKNCDIVISAVTITPEREVEFLFSQPYYKTGQILAVSITNENILSIDDLKGKQVGVQQGTTSELMAKKIDGAQVYSYPTIDSAFDELEKNNLEVVLNDFPTTLLHIKSSDKLKTVGGLISTENYGIALRKTDKKMLDEINLAINQLKEDDSYRLLHLKWFDVLPVEEELITGDSSDNNKEENKDDK